MSIIIALYVAISSNIIIVNSTTIDKEKNNYDNFTLACNISIIICLDNNQAYLQKIEDHKIQTDLILDQVNSTKLKEWIDILSSFHTRNTKSSYIE